MIPTGKEDSEGRTEATPSMLFTAASASDFNVGNDAAEAAALGAPLGVLKNEGKGKRGRRC